VYADRSYHRAIVCTVQKTVWEQLGDVRLEGGIKHIKKEEIHNPKSKTLHEFEYSSQALKYKEHEFYYISQVSEITNLDNPTVVEKSRFVNISSIPVNSTNIIQLIKGGRLRWKIENEGFNTQKTQGMNMQHKYVRNNFTGIRNYYMCMQIAHIIEQLFVLCKNMVMHGWKTIKGMWLHLWAFMLCVPFELPLSKQNKKLNFRY